MRTKKALPLVPVLALLLLCAPPPPAMAMERDAYSMEILVDGRPLEEYHARGRTYVEALENAEYSIRLTNRTGRRVAVALSVDGLNTIDARHTSAREGRKWILAPRQSIVLEGWQTASDTARRFYFTTEERSYGAWLGRTDNLGLVSAVFFREQRPLPVPYSEGEARLRQEGAPAPSGAADRGLGESKRRAAEAPSEDLAATGIGREVRHRVRRVQFDPEEHPAAVIEMRYEYRDALVRLGVLPTADDPLARRERGRGFIDSGFAPDPYRR